MKIKVESHGKRYTVNVAPYLVPYIQLLAMSIASVPTSIEQAKQSSESIKNAWKVLREHISPKPPDDADYFLDIIAKLSREVSNAIVKASKNANFPSSSTENP